MKESYKHYLYANVSAGIGILMLIGGGAFAVDAWGTMAQIEAQGLLGQAAYGEQYEQAVTNLQIGVVAILLGIFLSINAVGDDIQQTLWKLNEE